MSKELFVTTTPHETKLAVVEDDQLVEIFFERENEYTLAGSIYKGKVTRVLPGMQSAFVEIGLERDAFLYVTDFLEEVEAQDEDFSAPPAAKPAPERGRRFERHSTPRPSQPTVSIEADYTGEGDAAGTPEDLVSASGADTASETGSEGEAQGAGPRRWRGRRGRRRGRGTTGSRPEGEIEGGPSAEASLDSADASPIDDAEGEELSNIEGSREVAGEKPVREHESAPPAEPQRVQALPAREFRKPEPPPPRQRILLPGESLAKYNRKDQPRGSQNQPTTASEQKPEVATESRFTRPALRPSTEVTDPSAFQAASRGVLAGETLAKYRNRGAADPAPERVSAPEDAAIPIRIETAKPEHFPETTATVEAIPDVVAPIVPRMDESTAVPESESVVVAPIEDFQPPVAAIPPAAEKTTEVPGQGEYSFQPGSGVVEEEIIDEDEHEPAASLEPLEDAEFMELEEETLAADDAEAEVLAAGEGLATVFAESRREKSGDYLSPEELNKAVEFFDEEEEAAEEEEENEVETEEETEDESEEAELLAEGEAGREDVMDPDDPNFAGRAEMRQPAAKAGFQQKTERGFDRSGGKRRRSPGGRPMRRGGPRRNTPRGPMPQINELLKEGQEILVQIAKEPMAKKGARITSHIALPGRFLVFMPTVNHTGVSRKIGSEEERQRLKHILISEKGQSSGGFIVRTAASGASEEDLRADIRFLINLWGEIRQRAESSKAPTLLYHDLNLVERILRDQVTGTFSQIWVDSEVEYERILRFASRFQPSLVKRVKLYTKETPLFEQFNVTEEINKALKSKVWLKSGGYIVINQTEALVAIDINTGKYVGRTGRLEDTIVKTNIDAVKEIVRQIRLRDLGGIIIIDFIDMDERKNRQKVMQALEEALKSDRSPSKVLQFNDFGLVAITRKRVKQSLERTLSATCTYCTGTGMIKSVTTVCNEIFVETRKMAKHIDGHQVILRVNPEVGKALKESSGRWLTEMEEMLGKTIIVKSDPGQHQEQFEIL